MAYTQSILEKELTRKDDIKAGTPWKLLTVAFIAFATTIVIYIGLDFGFVPYMNSRIEKIDQNIEQLSASVSDSDAKDFFTSYSQLVNINDLLSSRYRVTELLSFIERSTLKNVVYANVSFSQEEKKLSLEGRATNYEVLAQQLEIYKNLKEVDDIKLESARLEEGKGGGVRFALRIALNLNQ